MVTDCFQAWPERPAWAEGDSLLTLDVQGTSQPKGRVGDVGSQSPQKDVSLRPASSKQEVPFPTAALLAMVKKILNQDSEQ